MVLIKSLNNKHYTNQLNYINEIDGDGHRGWVHLLYYIHAKHITKILT